MLAIGQEHSASGEINSGWSGPVRVHISNTVTVAVRNRDKLITPKGIPLMPRGNRLLGVTEMVEVLESMQSKIDRIVWADNRMSDEERELVDEHRALTRDAQSLAIRTQIAQSMIRGLEAPPERLHELIHDYQRVHGAQAITSIAAD